MRTIARWLRQVAEWLDPSGMQPYDRTADEFVAKAEQLGVDKDEYKRHWVLTRLRKVHPDVRTRDLSLAIEWAVRRLKG